MTPSAEPTSQRAEVAAYLVPADLLGDGEIIVLAIKPSGWFVLLASLPVLASAVVVAAAAYAVGIYQGGTPAEAILCFCALVAMGRVGAACWQWLGRTYVLTNRRIATVRGLLHVRVAAAGLSDVSRTLLAAAVAERLVGAGSIYCLTHSQERPAVAWNAIARPAEVHEIVLEAIDRARRVD